MQDNSNPVLFAVLLWLLLAAAIVVNTIHGGPLWLSADNAMQLAATRDLLAGQSWFDTTQWRMNTPYGLPMHWSHLVDAGLGGLILFLRLFMAPKTAELWALYAWPELLLLPALLAIARMGWMLAGRVGGLFALLLGASCSAATAPFRPGSIDHHNIQIVITLWMMAFFVDFARNKWAPAAAALMACLSLAIGMETLPYVVVAVLAVALWWVVDGEPVATRTFGIVFAAASALLLAGATASAYRFAASCDNFSGFYAALGVTGGLGLAGLSLWPARTRAHRAIAVVGLGAVMIALAAFLNPVCLKGPYGAVDPRLGAIWFSRISEVQSPFVLMHEEPGNFFAGYCYAVLAVLAAACAAFLVERRERRAALTVAAIAASALLVTSIEVRGLPFALLYALPGLAAFVVIGVERLRLSKVLAPIVLVASLFAASDASFALVGHSIQTSLPANRQFDRVQEAWMDDCLKPAAFRNMAALPAGRVLGLVDQGPSILAYTHHSAVGGAYHRNAAGILDTYAAFTGTPAQSAAVIARRGIDYVAICKPAPDYAFYRAHDGGKGVLSILAKGQSIAWLEPIASNNSPGKIELYRVLRAPLP